MAQCEICEKVLRTTQGLRGHKTFVHGLRADRSKITVDHENNSVSDYSYRLNKLRSEVVSSTVLLTELRQTVHALQNQLALKATASDIDIIATKVESLSIRVKKHDQWFNPKGINEVVLGLCGGPIAFIEKRLSNIQVAIQRRRISLG